MEAFRLIVEILGLVLGILAIILAMMHLHEITTQRAKLEETQRSLSTRYIGEFPDYLSQIADLITKAKKEILIFCDFPAYGTFTDHKKWLEYCHALENQSGRLSINITCFNEKGRLRSHDEQFSEAEEAWEEWKKSPKNKELLQHFLKIHKRSAAFNSLTKEEFANLLEEVDKQMLERAFSMADVRELDSYVVPLYFWLIDKREAIFTIPSFSNKHSEYGFFTADSRLISAFVEMRERYHPEAMK